MGGNITDNSDGVGVLTHQRAVDIARNTEGELDPTVAAYLDQAARDIWGSIRSQPDTYLLTKDEFAVFNLYRGRFQGDTAEQAVDRYWRATQAQERSNRRG